MAVQENIYRDSSAANQSVMDTMNYTGETYDQSVAKQQGSDSAMLNTGSGAEAAVGTQYSWDKKAQDMANVQYKIDSETAKQNSISNMQSILSEQTNTQAQADMSQYTDNQNADKMGWTGGMVLDQARSQDYFKATAQAGYYSALELQKYGLKSSLDAARYSYELNQMSYAQEFHQAEVQNALNEASITGTFFSPETKDMMAQQSAAQLILERLGAMDENGNYNEKTESDFSSAEDAQAYRKAKTIFDNIEKWYSSNGVSKAGVITMARWETESQMAMNYAAELYNRYYTAFSTAKDVNNQTTFLQLDENGNYIFTGGKTQTVDLDKMSASELSDYSNVGSAAAQQVKTYFGSLLNQAISDSTNTETNKIDEDRLKQELSKVADKMNAFKDENQGNLTFELKVASNSSITQTKPITAGMKVDDMLEAIKVTSSGSLTESKFSAAQVGDDGTIIKAGTAFTKATVSGSGGEVTGADDVTVKLETGEKYRIKLEYVDYKENKLHDQTEKFNKMYPETGLGSIVKLNNEYYIKVLPATEEKKQAIDGYVWKKIDRQHRGEAAGSLINKLNF